MNSAYSEAFDEFQSLREAACGIWEPAGLGGVLFFGGKVRFLVCCCY